MPFIHLATKTTGDVKACCRAFPPSGNIRDESLEAIWNNSVQRKIRKALLNGERPIECGPCWQLEDANVHSLRQNRNKMLAETYKERVIADLREDGTLPFKIPVLEIKSSNLCNLKCRMCHPLDSTSWAKDWRSIEHLMKENNESTYQTIKELNVIKHPYINTWEMNDQFWKDFEALVPHFERIEFAGGEPLIDPMHYKVLDILKPHGEHITLKYSTNLTTLQFRGIKVIEEWMHFKEIDLAPSVDGIFDVYNYVRQLGDFESMVNNMLFLKEHPKIRNYMIACTFSIYNISTLPEIFHYFSNDIGVLVHSHRVQYPKFLDMRVIPPKLKRKIAVKLQDFVDSIETFPWNVEQKRMARKNTIDNLNFLMSDDHSHLLPEFVEFSDMLDEKQNTTISWRDILPELHEHCKNEGICK